MRRIDRSLSQDEALKIIDESEYGVMSCVGDDGQIFSIPLSIVRDKMSIFIHGANSGTKANLFKNGREVSVVCVSFNQVPNLSQIEFQNIKNDSKALGNNVFTTEYKSAIAQTKVYEVIDEKAKINALRLLCEKYTPEFMEAFETAALPALKITKIYEFKIQQISAKAKIIK